MHITKWNNQSNARWQKNDQMSACKEQWHCLMKPKDMKMCSYSLLGGQTSVIAVEGEKNSELQASRQQLPQPHCIITWQSTQINWWCPFCFCFLWCLSDLLQYTHYCPMSLNTLWEWGTSMDSSPEYCNATPNMIISIQCHNHKKIERYRRNLYR